MVFISDPIWWTLSLFSLLLWVASLTQMKRNDWNATLAFLFGGGFFAVIVVVFVAIGWVGGLVTLSAGTLLTLVIGKHVSERLKLEHLRGKAHAEISDIWGGGQGERNWEKQFEWISAYQDEVVSVAKKRDDVMNALKERDLSPDSIWEIFSTITKSGTGLWAAEEIILDVDLLEEYFQMKEDNLDDEQIAYKFLQKYEFHRMGARLRR